MNFQKVAQIAVLALIAVFAINKLFGAAALAVVKPLIPVTVVVAFVVATLFAWPHMRKPGKRIYVSLVLFTAALSAVFPGVCAIVFTENIVYAAVLIPLFLITAVLGDTDKIPRLVYMGLATTMILFVVGVMIVPGMKPVVDRYAVNLLSQEQIELLVAYGAFQQSSYDRIGGAAHYASDYWSGQQTLPVTEAQRNVDNSRGFQDVVSQTAAMETYRQREAEWEAEHRGASKAVAMLDATGQLAANAPTFNMDDPAQAAQAKAHNGTVNVQFPRAAGGQHPITVVSGKAWGASPKPKPPAPRSRWSSPSTSSASASMSTQTVHMQAGETYILSGFTSGTAQFTRPDADRTTGTLGDPGVGQSRVFNCKITGDYIFTGVGKIQKKK